jgi:hypothetical protein
MYEEVSHAVRHTSADTATIEIARQNAAQRVLRSTRRVEVGIYGESQRLQVLWRHRRPAERNARLWGRYEAVLRRVFDLTEDAPCPVAGSFQRVGQQFDRPTDGAKVRTYIPPMRAFELDIGVSQKTYETGQVWHEPARENERRIVVSRFLRCEYQLL